MSICLRKIPVRLGSWVSVVSSHRYQPTAVSTAKIHNLSQQQPGKIVVPPSISPENVKFQFNLKAEFFHEYFFAAKCAFCEATAEN